MEIGSPFQPSPRALAQEIRKHGLLPFDIVTKVRKGTDSNAALLITNAISASVWDSINHLMSLDDHTLSPEHAGLIEDPELKRHIDEMDEAGKYLHTYNGTVRLHSGARVGIENMGFFGAIEYGLGSDHPFNAVKAARIFAKTSSMGLSLLHLEQLTFFISGDPDLLAKFHDARSRSGIPQEKIKAHYDKEELGCPAQLKIGPTAGAILKRHGLYEETYGSAEKASAIELITKHVREYMFREFDRINMELSEQEKEAHLCKGTRLILNRGLSA